MKLFGSITIAALAVAAVMASVGSATSQDAGANAAALREFEGTVVSVNRDARRFRLRDTERGTVRIKVTRATRFERLSGFAALKPGLKRIEATVRRSNGVWVAIEVERSGGGGEHGGDDDREDDDGSSGPGR